MTGIHEPKGYLDKKPLKSGFEEVGKGLPPVEGVRRSHNKGIISFLDEGDKFKYNKIEQFIPLDDMRGFGVGTLGRNGIEYPFMDKEGNPHATMEDVQRANDEIWRRNYPQNKQATNGISYST